MSINYGAARRSLPLTVLYDADCGLCSAVAGRLGRMDRGSRLRLVPLQWASTSGEPYVARVARTRAVAEVLHVVDATGAWASGGAAMIRIFDTLPSLRPLARLARLPIAGWVVEPAYRFVADHRHRISRLLGDVCRLPGAAGRRVG